jgi:hypothetical protein
VNIAGAQLAQTLLIVPDKASPNDGNAISGGPNGLSAFLSLVTEVTDALTKVPADVLDKTPPTYVTVAGPAETNMVSFNGDVSPQIESLARENPASEKNKSPLSASYLSKSTKYRAKEQPTALSLGGRSPQQLAIVSCKPFIAPAIATLHIDSKTPYEITSFNENETARGSIQPFFLAGSKAQAMSEPAIATPTIADRAVGSLAFAVLLTPSGPGTKDALQSAHPDSCPIDQNSASTVPTKSVQSSDLRVETGLGVRPGVIGSTQIPPFPTFIGSVANSAQFPGNTALQPLLQKSAVSLGPPHASAADLRSEQMLEPYTGTRLPSVAEGIANTSASSPIQVLEKHVENVNAARQDPQTNENDEPTERVTAIAAGLANGSVHLTDAATKGPLRASQGGTPSADKIVHSSASEANPSTSDAQQSKADIASKREPQQLLVKDTQTDGNAGTVIIAPTKPPDAVIAPEIRLAHPGAAVPAGLKATSDTEIKVAMVPPTTRQISLKLSNEESIHVNVDLTERAGKLLVAVRTSDHELAQSLQTDLGDLVGRLEHQGFKTETWIPSVANHAGAPTLSTSNAGPRQQHSDPGNGGAEQRQQGRNGSNHRQRARWTAQMEQTMSTNEPRSEI